MDTNPCRLCRLYGRAPVTPTRGCVCDPCRGDFTAALTALADRDAAGSREPERRGPTAGGPRMPGPRYPASIDYLSIVGPRSSTAPAGPDQVALPAAAPALDGWIAEIAEWREEPEPRAWYRDRARWLAEPDRFTWICDTFTEGVAGLARDVDSADRALARATGDGPTEHLIGRCTRAHRGGICGQRLTASMWDKAIICHGCGGSWPRREWRNLATEISREAA